MEAINMAVASNVETRVATERIRESEARIQQALASLYPTFRFVTSQANRTTNLASLGLAGNAAFPIPFLVGPFYTFDSRVQVLYTFIDAQSRWKVKSREIGEKIAEVEAAQARQSVTTMTALAYLALANAQHAQTTAHADQALAEKLLKLAKDRLEQGVVAGIDVTRAESTLKERELTVARRDEEVRRNRLELNRLVGLALDTETVLTDDLFPISDKLPNLAESMAIGATHRLDVQLAQQQKNQLQADLSAAQAALSPTVGLGADYGFAGNTPGQNVFATHNVALTLNIPLWDGGEADGREAELESRIKQADMKLFDLNIQIEQDIREALLRLELAAHQVHTARVSRELAEKELRMASDRFANGLTDSLEVSTAQAALTRALDAEVQALGQYNLGLVYLGAGIGSPEKIFEAYQGVKP